MDISKQIVDTQARNLVKDAPHFFEDYPDEQHKISSAFLLLGVASYLGLDIEEASRCLTDGGEDGGFDAAFIDDTGSELTIVLFQAKYTFNLNEDSSFPENALEKAVEAIRCIFDPAISRQLNEKSAAVVDTIHSLLYAGRIPQVTFVCLNNGAHWNKKGEDIINRAFGGQPQVSFAYYNCQDMTAAASKGRRIDVDLHLTGAATHEDFNYKSVIVGRVSVTEIANLMEKSGDEILRRNIRYYLGNSSVNSAIRNTLLDEDDNSNFFFYNNGITIICDKFSANYLQKENWIVKLENLQIINGGQTCRTIGDVVFGHPETDFSNAYVPVHIYQLDAGDTETISKITIATNNQNPVDLRDLRANDDRQRLLAMGALGLGYAYKPKWDSLLRADSLTIPSTVGMEAVFTVWREKPFLAKYRKSEYFSTYYEMILGKGDSQLNAAQMILAVRIFRFCDAERKKKAADPEKNMLRRYDSYLKAALLGCLLLKEMGIILPSLTLQDYQRASEYLESNKSQLYSRIENTVLTCIKEHLSCLQDQLMKVDGRKIASAFRNEEFYGKCRQALLGGE